MQKLIKAMVRHRLLVGMITVFTIAFGVFTVNNTKREDIPQVGLNTITITSIYPGASPEDVELNVTLPIERKLNGVSGVKKFTSFSTENYSVITFKADPSLNESEMQKVLDDVKSAVDQVDDLPANLDGKPVVEKHDINKLSILYINLSGPRKILRNLAYNMDQELRDVPGVATVEKVGYFDTEVYVEVNPWLMSREYISFPDVIRSIQSRNIRASGGSFRSFVGRQAIVTLSKFKNLKDVKDVIIRSNFERRKISVKDIATIRVRDKDDRLIVRNNGSRGITLAITKKPKADIITTVDAIRDYMKNRKLPKGVTYRIMNDGSERARDSINSLVVNAIIGVTLVFICLMIFLNIKTAFWAAFAIPFSVVGTFALLPLFGLTLNMISLAGFLIVIGMLVSAAIVVSEHIESCQEKGMSNEEASVHGASDMIQAISAATFTTIAAFVPMLFMGGTAGKFAVGVPIVVSLTLLVSLFMAIFLLPGYMAKTRPMKKERAAWIHKLEGIYKKTLIVVIRHKIIYVSFIVFLLFGTLFFAGKNMQFIMFDATGSKKFFIKYEAPVGSSLERTEQDVVRVEKIIRKMMKKHKGEITDYASRIGHNNGHALDRTSGDHENWAVTAIYLSDSNKRKRSTMQILRALKKKTAHIKSCKLFFSPEKFGPSQEKPVQVVVTGNDPDKREIAIKKVMAFLKKIKGVSDLDRDDKEGKKQLVIRLRYDQLAAYGLSTASVANLLRMAYDGVLVSSIQTLQEEIWYRVLLSKRYRKYRSSIRFLKVKNNKGRLIPLNRLVRFRTISSKQDLYHYNGRRSVTVAGEVDNINATSMKVGMMIEKLLLKKWTPPEGVSVRVIGEYEESKEIMGSFVVALIMALFAIFFIVALVLKKVGQTLFVMSLIPVGLIGVIWALYIHGLNFAFFSLLGFLGLIGIIVNDSIVMLDQLNKHHDDGDYTPEKIAEGAKTRLRPILMTTMTTIGGLIPGAYGIGGSQPFIVQLSITVAYGLMFCSLTTLFMVPVYYHYHGQRMLKKKAKLAAKEAAAGKKKTAALPKRPVTRKKK